MLKSIQRGKPLFASRGVALITALLITAFVAIAASAMAARQQLDIRRTENLMHGDQALIYAMTAESIVGDILLADPNANVDSLDEVELANTVLAAAAMAIPIQGGGVSLKLADLSGSFPLNHLIDKNGQPDSKYRNALADLFRHIQYDDPDNNKHIAINAELADKIQDWIDVDDQTTGTGGAEDPDYLGRPLAYRTANQPLVSLTELRLMADMTNDEYNLLVTPPEWPTPYVNVLPADAVININTAPKEVIMSLDPLIDAAKAETIISQRQAGTASATNPFPTGGFTTKNDVMVIVKQGMTPAQLQDFTNTHQQNTTNIDFDIKSNYFELTTTVVVGNSEIRLISLLKRDMQNKKVETLRRGIGVL